MRRSDFVKAMTKVDKGTKRSSEMNIAECNRALKVVIETATLGEQYEDTLLRNIAVAKRKKANPGAKKAKK